jgi:hypothetical protein
MWFDNDAAMNQVLNSSEMSAAVEDAKNFMDMRKTSVFVELGRQVGIGLGRADRRN